MGKVKLFPTAEYLEIGEDGGPDLSHPGPVHDGRR